MLSSCCLQKELQARHQLEEYFNSIGIKLAARKKEKRETRRQHFQNCINGEDVMKLGKLKDDCKDLNLNWGQEGRVLQHQ